MERFEDRYALLKVAYSDMEFAMTRSFLEANGIKVTSREKGFGGPIRSILWEPSPRPILKYLWTREILRRQRRCLKQIFQN